MDIGWFDFNREKILNIKVAAQQTIKDYIYHYILFIVPWYTIPIADENVISMNAKIPNAMVNLNEREAEVVRILNSEGIFTHMLNFCRPNERAFYATEEGLEDARKDIFECHKGAAFIAFLWMGFTNLTYEGVKSYDWNKHPWPNINKEEIALEQLKYLHGVYLINLRHSAESHAFVIWFKSDTITIYNSYGGYEGYYITTFQRDDWLNKIELFFNTSYQNQRELYPYLWGIRANMIRGVFPEDWSIRSNNMKRIFPERVFTERDELESIIVQKIY